MSKHNQKIGKLGEQAGAKYLQEQGYKQIAQNIRTPHGEIDLIMEKDDALIFVEVKTRSSKKYGYPEEAVTPKKLVHMMESAQYYIDEQREKYQKKFFQLDVLAIRVDKNNKISEIKHIQNVQN